MKTRFSFVTVSVLSFTLLFSSISSIKVFAEETGEKVTIESEQKVSTEKFEIDGNDVVSQTIENKDGLTLNVTGDNGYIHLTRVGDEVVDLQSDFLTKNELKQVKNDINSSIESSNQDNSTDVSIAPMGMTGDWANSAWRNYTVTASGKVTAEIIVTSLGAFGGKIGAIAGGLAAIMIENTLKTGYFKARNELRNDTVLGYYWERVRVAVYSDSARTKQVGSKVTEAKRYAPPTN